MNNIIESMNTRMDIFELRLDSITSTTFFKDIGKKVSHIAKLDKIKPHTRLFICE